MADLRGLVTATMTPSRPPAIDWMRGLVMVLMTVDHAAAAFNAGHLMTDSVRMYPAGTHLDPAQFLTRWITHPGGWTRFV